MIFTKMVWNYSYEHKFGNIFLNWLIFFLVIILIENEETSLKTEEIKNKELIEKYLHDKKFLDKLGGKEFLER